MNEGKLSLLTNADGGIIDDSVLANAGDHVYMVVNGATKHGDMAHFKEQMADFDGDVSMEYLEDQALVAVQGDGAAQVIQQLVPSDIDITKVDFMTGFYTTLAGIEGCRLTRCGYTGEDGFELSVPNASATQLAEVRCCTSDVLVTLLLCRGARLA